MNNVMSVNTDGRSRMTINVIIGLKKSHILSICTQQKEAHEYHSQAEYSAVIRSPSVFNPECVVLDDSISM